MPEPVLQPMTERLWSEEVGLANANEPLPPKDPGYEWSNGKTFEEGRGPYANPVTP